VAISFTDKFGLDKELFAASGAFDAILDVDSQLFIDPALLGICKAAEFKYAKKKVETYFSGIITLLSCYSRDKKGMYWRAADRKLTFSEPASTCFGYSRSGTGGNAIGSILRAAILETIQELVEVGVTDPSIFELLGVFQDRVGCDRISDLLTFILEPEIRSFTGRVMEEVGISNVEAGSEGAGCRTVRNEYNGKPILLLPADLLTPLPVADSFDDIDRICAENRRVRAEINAYLHLGRRRKLSKSQIFSLMKSDPSFRDTLIASYKSVQVNPYDFKKDPTGEYAWYEASRRYAQRYPCMLAWTASPTVEDVFKVVEQICEQFKALVEDNGLWELLYDSDKETAKTERAAQLLFYGVADAYCRANNIDLTRECNAGRGPVDFKLSHGAQGRVLVEVKLTSNAQLRHGIEKQLPIYMKQEKTQKAIYLIVDNGNPRALRSFHNFYARLEATATQEIPFVVVDATAQKTSASRA
jgi:hypothetical protein